MLINASPLLDSSSPFSQMIAEMNGNKFETKELRVGVYQSGHFGSSPFAEGWEEWFEVDGLYSYGVCDSVEQLLARCPSLEGDPNRQFMVRVTPVLRKNQSPEGGWRWHKWGEYIGTHIPQCEYLYDEQGIDGVLCFHIYERRAEAEKHADAEREAAPSASAAPK